MFPEVDFVAVGVFEAGEVALGVARDAALDRDAVLRQARDCLIDRDVDVEAQQDCAFGARGLVFGRGRVDAESVRLAPALTVAQSLPKRFVSFMPKTSV